MLYKYCKDLIWDISRWAQIMKISSKENKTLISIMIIAIISSLVLQSNNNVGECMAPEEYNNNAQTIAKKAQEGDTISMEEFLTRIRNRELSPEQLIQLDNLTNTELNNNPENMYSIHSGHIHSTGNRWRRLPNGAGETML